MGGNCWAGSVPFFDFFYYKRNYYKKEDFFFEEGTFCPPPQRRTVGGQGLGAGAVDGGDADGHREVAHPVAEALRGEKEGEGAGDGGNGYLALENPRH